MDSYEQPSSSSGISPMVWIIGAVAVVCGCLTVLGIGALGFMFYGRSSVVAQPAPIGAFATTEAIVAEPAEPEITEVQIVTIEAGGETLEVEEHPSEGVSHTDEGALVTFNTDPPTSGTHYPVWGAPGFYDEVVEDGYLVHNLEHGYIIIWYDCDQTSDCDGLQDQIIELIAEWDGYKIIAAPRSGMDTPITLTSWTRLARMDEFNADLIGEYITQFHNDAPEPNAP